MEGGQVFCDISTKALLMKCMTIEGEGQNSSKLRDVNYGRPLTVSHGIFDLRMRFPVSL